MCNKVLRLLALVSLVSLMSAGTSLGFNAGKDPSLVGWWRLDDGTGTVALDSSGNGNDGQIQGNPAWVAGILGGALQMDGAGDYINCGNGPTLDIRDQITLSFWIKTDGFTTDWSAIISKGDGSWRMSRSATTGNALHMGFGGTTTAGNTYMDGAITVTDGEWHHGAGVYDGAEAQIYVDGVLDVTQAATGQLASATYDVLIGENAQQTGRYLNATLDDVRIYNRALTLEEIEIVMEGEFAPIAADPSPADEATDVARDVVLAWTAGEFAATHDVYFGTSFDDVNTADFGSPVLVSPGQETATYDPPGRLEYGQTYYWRVDEVNAPPTSDTVFKGNVWSFTAEPLYYSVQDIAVTASIPTADGSGGPEVTVNGSGLTDGQHGIGDLTMWSGPVLQGETPWLQYDFDRVYKLYGIHVWNYNGLYEYILGFGVKDVTIEYATEPNEWMPLGQYTIARGTSKTTYAGQLIELDGLPVRSIRLNIDSTQTGGMMAGLSEIQFMYKPTFARQPEPPDGAIEVSRSASLKWRAGREAASHQVSLGTDSNAVADGLALVNTVTTASYNPDLRLGTTYYWKVDEVNDLEDPTIWNSAVWSFTTQEYVSLDDFESYTDDEGNRVYETWLDGYGTNDNGSQVGHDNPPYAEDSIRHSGAQAMPMYYRNTEGKTYSETEVGFSPAQDLTANGADTLSLYYRGEPTGFVQIAEDNIIMNGIGNDIWGTTDQFRFVYKQLTGDGSIIARVEHLDNTNEWAKAGVMIRETLDADSALVDGVVSADRRACMQWRSGRAIDMGSPDASSATVLGSFEFPHWVKLTRTGNVFKVQHSADGVTWVDIVPETASDPTQITQTMPQTVYIGLAVCSHNAGAVAGAQFTGIATTGNVTGQWQSEAIGLEQPAGNDLDRFYLAVEDSAGKKATFVNPSATAVGMGSWQQWTIPLSDIAAAGVKTNSINKLYLGVGDKTQPSKNASGVLYIDDIGFGHPLQ